METPSSVNFGTSSGLICMFFLHCVGPLVLSSRGRNCWNYPTEIGANLAKWGAFTFEVFDLILNSNTAPFCLPCKVAETPFAMCGVILLRSKILWSIMRSRFISCFILDKLDIVLHVWIWMELFFPIHSKRKVLAPSWELDLF